MKRFEFLLLRVAAVTCLAAALSAPIQLHAAASEPANKKKSSAPAKSSGTAQKKPQKTGISQDPYIGAIVIDAQTGKVLAEDKSGAKGYPASMLKLMDLFIILEKVSQKQITLQDQVTVSARASKTGGSQVWLKEKEVFTIEELLYALMIQSANDAAVALAEKVAGSSEGFVELMNQKAREIGMTSTVFQSPHGLPPSAGQQPDVTNARDFAILCRELITRHPDALQYTSARERTFRPGAAQGAVVMRTHNHLLTSVAGCDGLKTGYFSQAGFSVAATATRNGQRVIAVILGSTDRKVRDAKAAEFMAKGFAALPALPAAPAPAVAMPAAANATAPK